MSIMDPASKFLFAISIWHLAFSMSHGPSIIMPCPRDKVERKAMIRINTVTFHLPTKTPNRKKGCIENTKLTNNKKAKWAVSSPKTKRPKSTIYKCNKKNNIIILKSLYEGCPKSSWTWLDFFS